MTSIYSQYENFALQNSFTSEEIYINTGFINKVDNHSEKYGRLVHFCAIFETTEEVTTNDRTFFRFYKPSKAHFIPIIDVTNGTAKRIYLDSDGLVHRNYESTYPASSYLIDCWYVVAE